MSQATDELLAAVTSRYDGPDNEAARLLEQTQGRLAWRLRHSGKECERCRESKSLAGFSRDSRNPDGLRRYCRQCDSSGYKGRRVND